MYIIIQSSFAQGSIVDDLRHADMVLLGGKGQHSGALEMMYYQIQNGFKVANVHTMSAKAAELTKIAVNCYLTTKITYANQVGQVMIRDGMEDEVKTVLKAIGSDSRIGTKYLNYGFGFGGYLVSLETIVPLLHMQVKQV